jgi:hypothetical protein
LFLQVFHAVLNCSLLASSMPALWILVMQWRPSFREMFLCSR